MVAPSLNAPASDSFPSLTGPGAVVRIGELGFLDGARHFPAQLYGIGSRIHHSGSAGSAATKSTTKDFSQLYPDGDPHLGVIPAQLLALLEDPPSSAPPPSPLALAQAQAAAEGLSSSSSSAAAPLTRISPEVWTYQGWERARNGSTTTFADTSRAAHQAGMPDFRKGTTYAGWKPPLALLSDDDEEEEVQQGEVEVPPAAAEGKTADAGAGAGTGAGAGRRSRARPAPLPKVQYAFTAPERHSGMAGQESGTRSCGGGSSWCATPLCAAGKGTRSTPGATTSCAPSRTRARTRLM